MSDKLPPIASVDTFLDRIQRNLRSRGKESIESLTPKQWESVMVWLQSVQFDTAIELGVVEDIASMYIKRGGINMLENLCGVLYNLILVRMEEEAKARADEIDKEE